MAGLRLRRDFGAAPSCRIWQGRRGSGCRAGGGVGGPAVAWFGSACRAVRVRGGGGPSRSSH
eukprot:8186107-Lingulodinium_polyedra.AAC.1